MAQIRIENLGKRYRRYASRLARLADWVLPFYTPAFTDNWIIRKLNFEVQPGEAVGIVGMNGAGKSTLLKLITGTSMPNEGQVIIHGRVAALLELGMGFHPDMTGRQNALSSLQLLGSSPAESEALIGSIVEFSEIGDYFDQPLRVYSSGMQIRLAFSVATAIRPDVLIVDEALSVGDTYFQHKSFERIRQFNKAGTTLLLVSHDKSAIQTICNRALLLHKGSILKEGPPDTVFDLYNALIAEKGGENLSEETLGNGKVQVVSGTGAATIEQAELRDPGTGAKLDVVQVGQPVRLVLKAMVHKPVEQMVIGYCIKDRLGQNMFGTNTFYLDQVLTGLQAGQQVEFTADFPANLGVGSYSVSTALTSTKDHLEECYFWKDLHLVFEVLAADHPVFVGSNWMPPTAVELRLTP